MIHHQYHLPALDTCRTVNSASDSTPLPWRVVRSVSGCNDVRRSVRSAKETDRCKRAPATTCTRELAIRGFPLLASRQRPPPDAAVLQYTVEQCQPTPFARPPCVIRLKSRIRWALSTHPQGFHALPARDFSLEHDLVVQRDSTADTKTARRLDISRKPVFDPPLRSS